MNWDGYVSTGQGILGMNMFTYCLNNPVNLVDPDGYAPIPIPPQVFERLLEAVIRTATVIVTAATAAIVAAEVSRAQHNANSGTRAGNPPSSAAAGQATAPRVGAPATTWSNVRADINSRVAANPRQDDNSRHLHHIVPQGHWRAQPARDVLTAVGINYRTDPRNLVPLRTSPHSHMHTYPYIDMVNRHILHAYNSAGGDPARQHANVTARLGLLQATLLAMYG